MKQIPFRSFVALAFSFATVTSSWAGGAATCVPGPNTLCLNDFAEGQIQKEEASIMQRISIHLALCVLPIGLLLTGPALADDVELSGYMASFEADYERAADKLLQLAKAIPADKYGWSPAEGARTIAQVIVHTGNANFGLAQRAGVAMPEGINPREAEKTITAKEDVIRYFRRSLDHVYEAAAVGMDADLDKKIELFDDMLPIRRVYLIISGHVHEHLGQLIAYARSIGVTPPWSRSDGDGGEE